MKVWKIERVGDKHHNHKGKLFARREHAENLALGMAKEAHKIRVDEMQAEVSEGYMSKEESDWWLSNPPLNMHSDKKRTFYGCGDIDWCSMDRRSAQYFWVVGVKVIS